jgi:hypothetical protein
MQTNMGLDRAEAMYRASTLLESREILSQHPEGLELLLPAKLMINEPGYTLGILPANIWSRQLQQPQ